MTRARDERKRRLQAELDSIYKEEQQEQLAAAAQHRRLCMMHIDTLLVLTPEHSYLSCSDDKLYTAGRQFCPGDCARCVLLDIKKNCIDQWPSCVHLQLSINITEDGLGE